MPVSDRKMASKERTPPELKIHLLVSVPEYYADSKESMILL